MAPRVYLETTIPSYLTAWPSRDVIRAAHQQVTRQWWEFCRTDFDLVVSQLVLEECSAGDEDAATARLKMLEGIPLLGITDSATDLALSLVKGLALPARAVNDALHIAVAAVHGVEFLLTWNCKHIANAALQTRIAIECEAAGFSVPIIATPEQLLGEE